MRPCFVAFPSAWRRRFEGLCSGSASYSGPQLTPPRNERSRRSAVPCMPDVKIWGEQIFAYLLTYAAVSAIISVRSDPPIYFCEHLFEKTVFRIRRVRAELKGVPAGLSGPVGAICKPKKTTESEGDRHGKQNVYRDRSEILLCFGGMRCARTRSFVGQSCRGGRRAHREDHMPCRFTGAEILRDTEQAEAF